MLPSPLTTTYFIDTAVINGTTYFYRIGTYNCVPTLSVNVANDEASAMPKALTIYDLQFNNTTQGSGNDCYPGDYNGQAVTVTGVVFAKGFSGDKYFICDPGGGAWHGIYIYDWQHSVSLGDLVQITGQATEDILLYPLRCGQGG